MKRGSYPSPTVKSPKNRTPPGKARPLAAEFSSQGWVFRQIRRYDGVYLYLKQKPTYQGGTIRSWEVVVPVVRQEKQFPDGTVTPHREVYPIDDDWGIRGWTYQSESDAQTAFGQRCAAQATAREGQTK